MSVNTGNCELATLFSSIIFTEEQETEGNHMNFFGFITKITHPENRNGWVETTAYFTGESRKPERGRGGYYPVDINVAATDGFLEYGIRYYVGDKERIGWYIFYPAPDPDPNEIKDTPVKIRYMKKRPWIFENVELSE